MNHNTPYVLACVRTSTSPQDERAQLQILKSSGIHFDEVLLFPNTDGGIPLCCWKKFRDRILAIRRQHPNTKIVLLVTHIDRFLKARSVLMTRLAWKQLDKLGVELRCVAPFPKLPPDLSAAALADSAFKLLVGRLLELGHAKTRQTRRIEPAAPHIRGLTRLIALDVAALSSLPEARDPKFLRFAAAWRVFGGYRLFLKAIGTGTGAAARNPQGWGSAATDLDFFERIKTARADGLGYKRIAALLGAKRDDIRYVLNQAPGYKAYVKPVVVPDGVPQFTSDQKKSWFQSKHRAALDALAQGHHVLLESATGSRKTRVALRHHKALLAANPDHVTVFCVPNTSIVHHFVGRYGGVGLAGKRDSSLVQHALRTLKAHQTGGLLFAIPDWLHRDEVWRSIRSHASVFLVVDEADAAVADADYRDSYRDFPDIVRHIRPQQVLAMTATCPPLMRPLLKAQVLPKGQDWTVVRAPLDRPNLFYRHEHMANDTARLVRTARIAKHMVGLGHRGIINLDTKKRVDRWEPYLRECGLRVGGYHSGRTPSDNLAVLRAFERGELDVVVCTSAFGRGLDMNVGFVVVAHAPENLSMLSQYLGREGRDGKPAFGWWLTGPSDTFFLDTCRRTVRDSDLDEPTMRCLLEMTDDIQDAAGRANRKCLREILLNAHGRKPRHTNSKTCCRVCQRMNRRTEREHGGGLPTQQSGSAAPEASQKQPDPQRALYRSGREPTRPSGTADFRTGQSRRLKESVL